MLLLRTLGGLSLDRDGQNVPGAGGQRTRIAVLAIIASAGERGIARERIQAILWPEADTEHARGNLKQALFGLRAATDVKDLVIGTDEIRLNPDVIRVDRWEFDAAVDSGDLVRAVAAYTGPFLDAVSLRNNAEFDQWREREENMLAASYRQTLRRLAEQAEADGAWGDAVSWLRRLSASDPFDSSVAAALIRAHAAAGDSASALRHARGHAKVIREELGAEVDPVVAAAVQEIRRANDQAIERTNDGSKATPASTDPFQADREPPRQPTRRGWTPRSIGLAGGVVAVALLAGIVIGPRFRTPGFDRVMVVRGSDATPAEKGACARSDFEDRVTGGLVALRLATVVSARPRYLVTVGCPEEKGEVVLTAQVRDVVRGAVVGVAVERARLGADFGPYMDEVRNRVMALLGVRLHPRLLLWQAASEMPERWDAVQELALGLEAWGQGQKDEATAHWTAAATLDSTSGTALVLKAMIDPSRSDTVIARALARPRLGEWERSMLNRVRFAASGDLAGAYAASHGLMSVVPHSEWAWLLALDAINVGRSAEMLRVLRAMDPEARSLLDPVVIAQLETGALHYLGKHVEELSVARTARRASPNNRTLMQWEAKALAALGRGSEVEAVCLDALALRPRTNWSDTQPCDQSILELQAHGQPDAARRLVQRVAAALDVAPEGERAGRWTETGESLASVGEFAEAERQMRASRWFDSTNSDYLTIAVQAAAKARNRPAVDRLLRRLDLLGPWKPGTGEEAWQRARVSALLGDREEAVQWMLRSFREGFPFRGVLHWDPAFATLRGYPAWDALLKPVDDQAGATR